MEADALLIYSGLALILYVPFVVPSMKVLQDSGLGRCWRAYVPLWGFLIMYDFMGWNRFAILWVFVFPGWILWVLFANPARIGNRLWQVYGGSTRLRFAAMLPILNIYGLAAIVYQPGPRKRPNLATHIEYGLVRSTASGKQYIASARGGALMRACLAEDWPERRCTEGDIKHKLQRPEFYGDYDREAEHLQHEGYVVVRIAGKTPTPESRQT
ncbi:MAG TPA: hypothetical protein VH951_00535 [Dehalococcoidia bacterium]